MKRLLVTGSVAVGGCLLAGVLAALATMGIHDHDTRIIAGMVFGFGCGIPLALVCIAMWERQS